jgi:hypothetical protein
MFWYLVFAVFRFVAAFHCCSPLSALSPLSGVSSTIHKQLNPRGSELKARSYLFLNNK